MQVPQSTHYFLPRYGVQYPCIVGQQRLTGPAISVTLSACRPQPSLSVTLILLQNQLFAIASSQPPATWSRPGHSGQNASDREAKRGPPTGPHLVRQVSTTGTPHLVRLAGSRDPSVGRYDCLRDFVPPLGTPLPPSVDNSQ